MNTSVLHVSFSRSGGAGGVAEILSEARSAAGFPTSHWYSIEKNLRIAPWSAPRHTVAAVFDDTIIRNPDFNAPISVARDSLSLQLGDQFESWDVLHLHNVNGVLTLALLAERFPTKRIVWTLHDMNPMTGACHYSLGCTGYLSDCSSCPAVRGPFQRQVSASLSQKTRALAKFANLAVVAPSQWLADRASESSAMRTLSIPVIPNPIRPVFCTPPNIPANNRRFTFCIVAQNLSDPVKNVGMAVRAFLELKKTHPHISLALIGNNGSAVATEGITALGPLPAEEIAETLGETSSLIVPSLAENSPLVIAEAAAQGTASIVNNVGGMPDMVTSLGAGAVFSNEAELYGSLVHVVQKDDYASPASRQALSGRATNLFSPASVSQQYDDLYRA